MIPDGLISYTWAQLEEMAAFDLRSRPDVEKKPPINVEVLLEHLANVTIEYPDGLRTDYNCEGCVCKDAAFSRRIIVMIDFGMLRGPWCDYNAVVAEEYAHIKIHPSLFWYVTSPEDFIELQQDPQWSQYEQDARRYSLAIRMPPNLVLQAAEEIYPRIVDEHGFGDAARASILLRNAVAELFRVPTKDAQRRLMNFPCDIRNRFLNSFQSRSSKLLPDSWSVKAAPPLQQRSLFGQA